jgi:hypothetical protein
MFRSQFWNLWPGEVCFRSWAVIAQNVIRSPQSQMIDLAPEPSFLAAAFMIGSLDIVFLQLGQMI